MQVLLGLVHHLSQGRVRRDQHLGLLWRGLRAQPRPGLHVLRHPCPPMMGFFLSGIVRSARRVWG
jgi:hypothetical protein